MREINKVIVHCTATPENRVVTVEDVRQWHKARGWSDIGYHIMIYLDGTVHEGRPIERSGAHCKGQNRNSIGIAYVGGVDKAMNPKDTRTEYPKVEIFGHRDFSSKACPSFDAAKEYENITNMWI
jgi:N-acetylmuramoyl-L-alanine amidase